MTKQEFIAAIERWYNGKPLPFTITETNIENQPALEIHINGSTFKDYVYFYEYEIEPLNRQGVINIAYLLDHLCSAYRMLNY